MFNKINKIGIIGQQQGGITQFKIMTSSPSTGATTSGQTTTLPTSNVILQSSASNTSASPQSTATASTIRKVGSSGNLQKVQVIANSIKPIQILSNPGQRVTKTTTIQSAAHSANTSQYQQVFQQQASKLNPQPPSS